MKILHAHSFRSAVVLAMITTALAVVATAQQPAATATPDAEQVRAMKMKYAAARAKVQTDPEYQAAVKRAEEARRAAEALFFAKMRRADPELKNYLDRLEGKQASPAAAPSVR
jgi:hypothetical protein